MNNCDKKIVLVVKASEVGERGLKKAIDIIREEDCNKLYLLFVVDHDFFSGDGASYVKSKQQVDKGLEGIGDAILRTMEDMLEETDKSIESQRVILHGKTAEEIMNFAKNNKVDVLIIPKDQRGPIEKFITGGDITPFIDEIKKYVDKVVVVE